MYRVQWRYSLSPKIFLITKAYAARLLKFRQNYKNHNKTGRKYQGCGSGSTSIRICVQHFCSVRIYKDIESGSNADPDPQQTSFFSKCLKSKLEVKDISCLSYTVPVRPSYKIRKKIIKTHGTGIFFLSLFSNSLIRDPYS
jgi:hypothetical protein